MKFAPLVVGSFALILTGAVSVPGSASATDKPKADRDAGRFYFPNRDEAGTRTVKSGEEIIRRPVVYSLSAKIAQTVRLRTSEGPAEILAGTVLPAVRIVNLPGQQGDVLAYCTPVVKANPALARGMFGVLGAKLIKSATDGRKCLFDRDGDGIADHAFLIDDGTAEDRAPQPIPPIALDIAENQPAGAGDYVSIRLRKASRPSFVIDIFENGKALTFDTITSDGISQTKRPTVEKDAALPIDYEIYGAKFQILGFDKKDGSMTIQWSADHRELMRSVPSEIVFVYRYY